MFSGLAHRKYGLRNVGFHLSNQIVTMDFDKALTKEQLKEMEWEINEAIVANVEIKSKSLKILLLIHIFTLLFIKSTPLL